MSAECIDGVRIRGKILSWIEQSLAGEARHHGPPGLAVIRVGEDPASVAYIARNAGRRSHWAMPTGNGCSNPPSPRTS